jgi:hypothetical protein
MSLAKVVSLPTDFVAWNKVGYPIDGKLRVITNKESILLPRTFDDTLVSVGNADAGNEIGSTSGIYFSPHYRGGNFIGGLYGLPGGIDEAYFRFDLENRQIVFSGSTPRSEVVLEYTSTGLKLDGSSLIPRESATALRTYVLWQSQENDPRVAYNAKERLKREHEEAVAALRFFQSSFTADEFRQMIYQSLYQAPKR